MSIHLNYMFLLKMTEIISEEDSFSIRESETIPNKRSRLVSPVKIMHNVINKKLKFLVQRIIIFVNYKYVSYFQNSIHNYKLLDIFKEITLPTHWLTYQTEQGVTFYLPKYKTNQEKLELVIEKQIVFSKNFDINYYVNQKRIEPELGGMNKLVYPLNVDSLTETIKFFNSKQICQGGPRVIDFPGKIVITKINIIYANFTTVLLFFI